MRQLNLEKYLIFLSKKYTKFTSLIFRTTPGSWEKDVLLCADPLGPRDPYPGMIPPFGKGKPPKWRNRTPPKR